MSHADTPTSKQQPPASAPRDGADDAGLLGAAIEYWVDATQRALLFWDVMRQRGNQYFEHMEKAAPHVLNFEAELLVDGRRLPRPVNYAIARIVPREGDRLDDRKRPFVVVDPRAGHGPGIGGFKADSEIGAAMAAGHPCYFIGFLPVPEPDQTIEHVLQAMGVFLEKVNELHSGAEGKPAVIGNCQAGWAVMMLASIRPELFGPIIVAGSPLSYWAGVHGVNPMRYSGGLLGGSWLTALTSDLGNGKFDGAWLVQNFEGLNPANTLWTKQYNLYANIDTEARRYLGFEKWWGGHVLLTGDEMQAIVDKLFIGNKLSSGEIRTRDGVRVDLRNVKGPIVVLCSKGDNITPPQQALGWILDLYDSVDDIRAQGQTIVYTVHETVGHLGIFVSGSVARKEHTEFTSNIDLIDILPPGLYEAVLTKKAPGSDGEMPGVGEYIARFEARTLDDIRRIGGNDLEDDRRFAAVERVSEISLGLYRQFVAPWVRACSNEALADTLRRLHPLRLQYELLSDRNPWAQGLAQAAEAVRGARHPVAPDNPWLTWQNQVSNQITAGLKAYGDVRDWMAEQIFLSVYGNPLIQALVGLAATDAPPRRRPGKELEHLGLVAQRIEQLKAQIGEGGGREAAIRAMLYIGLPDGTADERSFAVVRQIREESGNGMPLSKFKTALRQQFLMLLLDEEHAIAAIPDMVRRDPRTAQRILPALQRVVAARGSLSPEGKRRFDRIMMILHEAMAPITVEHRKAQTRSMSAAGDGGHRPKGRRVSAAKEKVSALTS